MADDSNDTDEEELLLNKHKDKIVATRVSAELYNRAMAKAKKENRDIGAILRSWLFGWVIDEAPTPPRLLDEDKRAPKRKKKKK